MKSYVRRAHHAGSWYSEEPNELDEALANYLAKAMVASSKSSSDVAYETESTTDSENGNVDRDRHTGVPRASISPHAGFQYSGPTAAYSYLALKEALISNPSLRTVVVLHPSHHIYLDGCAVSGEIVVFDLYPVTLSTHTCLHYVNRSINIGDATGRFGGRQQST